MMTITTKATASLNFNNVMVFVLHLGIYNILLPTSKKSETSACIMSCHVVYICVRTDRETERQHVRTIATYQYVCI